jgi:Golgi apyrase
MDEKDNYGIVIDSGSSGSRIQVFLWRNPQDVGKSDDNTVLNSPPAITHKAEWSKKISPGVSTYEDKVGQIWSSHYHDLIEFAEGIVPHDKHSNTPIFVLATAGMRMVAPKKQKKMLKEICSAIQKKTDFYLPECDQFVQIIDGETEGIYGWLALNYLMGQFENYDEKLKKSIGFMDMGGASTQIAFVPSQDQIEKHRDDLSTVTLRNINGKNQEWNVFVETWLGFGANQARSRYLDQLVSLSLVNSNTVDINDPCLPKGAELDYQYSGRMYNIKGIGNYQVCMKTIYPLLLKNIPCKDDPCLFNGIHGPKLDFDNDKFVGISEYWYTANDVFGSGGEYNYHSFNEKVRDFCESDWSNILEKSKNGQYSNLDPDRFLKSACFKASWVMNVLHEGFDLPRLGIDISEDETGKAENLDNVHVPFQSANSVNGGELSWTLGKMLLYASSQVEAKSSNEADIGIYPSEISGKQFVAAPGRTAKGRQKHQNNGSSNQIYSILVLFLVLFMLYHLFKRSMFKFRKVQVHIPKAAIDFGLKIPFVNKYVQSQYPYQQFELQNSINYDLEEGVMPFSVANPEAPNSSFLRTRLTMNLTEGNNDDEDTMNGGLVAGRGHNSFLNKPFPKRSNSNLFNLFSANTSKESLHTLSGIQSSKKE